MNKFDLNINTNLGKPHICGELQLHDNPIGEVSICNKCNLPVDKKNCNMNKFDYENEVWTIDKKRVKQGAWAIIIMCLVALLTIIFR